MVGVSRQHGQGSISQNELLRGIFYPLVLWCLLRLRGKPEFRACTEERNRIWLSQNLVGKQ